MTAATTTLSTAATTAEDSASPNMGPTSSMEVDFQLQPARVVGRDRAGTKIKGVIVTENEFYDIDDFPVPEYYKPYLARVVLPCGLVENRVERLAIDIYSRYRDSTNDVILVCILKSASRFFHQLTHSIRRIAAHDVQGLPRPAYRELYVRASSYVGCESSGHVRLCDCAGNIEATVKGQDVVIVDDILDSGCTLDALNTFFSKTQCKSFASCVLLAKRVDNWSGYQPDWVGFDVPGFFIIGYGIDYNDRFRDLDPVCVINAEGVERFKQDRNC